MKFLVSITLAAVFMLPLSSFTPNVTYSVVSSKSPKHNSKIARKLELTEEQQTKVKELSTELQKTTKDLRKSISENRKKILEMITNDTYSTANAEVLLKENAELERKIDATTLATHEKLMALLTSTQLQKLKEYNKGADSKRKESSDGTDDNSMSNSFPREDAFSYNFAFNGVPSPMSSNGIGSLLPRGERELLFPSQSLFAFSMMDGESLAPLHQLEELQLFNDDIDIPPSPRLNVPKPPRPPKAPRIPNMENIPRWDFDVEDSDDETDERINQKMEELEQKLKELEKRLEQKAPKNK